MSLVPFSHISALRCLVIDDMPTMRQNIRMHLGQLGVTKVDQAATPDEAIRFVQSGNYDLIICDYNLNKESNGQQLLEFFRTQNMLSPTSMFIMVTAESGYNLVASAAEFQPDAYMLKPLTASRIAERVDRLLEKQHAMLPVTEKMKRKDFAGAIIECDNVLKAAPKWIVEIMKTKGTLLIEQRRIDEAREVYQQALGMRDDLVWAKIGLARCNIVAGQLSDARTIIQDVLAQNKQFIAAYDLLAQIDEAQGNQEGALAALTTSSEIIPSARRSRLVGEVAYRSGHLDQAREAYDKVLKHTKGSLTAQPTDLLSLAQVHVDSGDPDQALRLLESAPRRYEESSLFTSAQAAVQAQAYVQLGDTISAQQAFEAAKQAAGKDISEVATLALAKAAFSMGKDDEGAKLIADAIKSDHENKNLQTLARKVLADTGKNALADELIDGAVKHCMSIIAEANALMRSAKPDESLAKLEEALNSMPENTGVLLASAQLHLLWMSQRGWNDEYVKRVRRYLATLDRLIPGNDRVAKMHKFLRDTLSKVAPKS
ncbi:tetratricopeptide repeat protein [Herbaspirillum sp. LeCh32-8]|uniref:tetratricopeptide repeat protein n=1 Tax=Herbaspirillum sp. LeCh32-8 TaxID=2821356 RepID=UPI001AE986A7|nr:tetratricopeptide repeat protein [Herbaspirillum sp. LeCh32-8]MBP0600287.1 tetratricopeptide repeat protein [Herbaspirillum sp. LeCh32-8]